MEYLEFTNHEKLALADIPALWRAKGRLIGGSFADSQGGQCALGVIMRSGERSERRLTPKSCEELGDWLGVEGRYTSLILIGHTNRDICEDDTERAELMAQWFEVRLASKEVSPQ